MKYRKKPVVIEAIQYNHSSTHDVIEWLNLHTEGNISKYFEWNAEGIVIKTLEGKMQCKDKDWIIKGVNGEFYPCKPDIFDKTYEPDKKTLRVITTTVTTETTNYRRAGKLGFQPKT